MLPTRPPGALAPAAALAVLALAAPALAAAPLTDAQVRAFVAEQERQWNAGDLSAYYAGFRPDAVFTDRYRTPDGRLVPYGSSTLAEARAQTRRFRARSRVVETHRVVGVTLAPDGRTAEVVTRVTSRIQGPAGARTTCADRRQRLVLTGARLRSAGAADTFFRCGPSSPASAGEGDRTPSAQRGERVVERAGRKL